MNAFISPMPQRRYGFTLIELLVVVAIISVLASMLLPALQRARGEAKMIKNLSNLRQIQLAVHMYASDNNDYLMLRNGTPPNNAWPCWAGKLIGEHYLSDPTMFWGPMRNTGWFGTHIWDSLEEMKTNPSANSYQHTGYAVNARLMGKQDEPISYRLDTDFPVHSAATNQNPSPDEILLMTEFFHASGYDGEWRVDGWYAATHSADDWLRPFTYRGKSAQAYLDAHVVATTSRDIGWQATGDRSGFWIPGSHNHWARQGPWFRLN